MENSRAISESRLVGDFVNGAQPIDAHFFKDDDGKIYLLFGGWGHCNIALMNEDMTGFDKIDGKNTFIEITPEDYVEGPCMLKRNGIYYFMWSSGNWTDGSYRVDYAVSKTITGSYKYMGTVLEKSELAEGPGHHSFLKIMKTREWQLYTTAA